MNLKQQELISVVLGYVNKARVAMGMDEILDLPQGEVNEPTQCPLANALSNDFIHATVLEHTIEFTYYNFQVSVLNALREVWNTELENESCGTLILPEPLTEFVMMFDDQKFPDYITPDPEDEEEGEDEEDEGEGEDINP